ERTTIQFDAALLDAPIIQTEAALKSFLRSAPQSVFLKYKSTDSWTARVRRRLRRCLGSQAGWPTLDDLAVEFHVAPSTLRRRLEAEGGTYQSAKDDLRRDAAIHHLCHSRLSIAEISTLLGFQEPSAFHRAFKKWTGSQPGEYRALRSDGASAPGAVSARRPATAQAALSG
ncbi:MAG: AraC family transcriptional regulator, partial [Methylibium sp.]|nr:AraC family transcriptional regulator [Methylibium sp.]